MAKDTLPDNPFYNIAEILGKRGEDMEVVATELAQALRQVVVEGMGAQTDESLLQEIKRLLNK